VRTLALLLLVIASAAAPVQAGLWDRDRPETLPDVFDVITGRFDRFPEAYYTAREQRISTELAGLPAKPASEEELQRVADALGLYDDAAVAALRCELRGSFSHAVALLSRKLELAEIIRPTFTARASAADQRTAANRAECLRQLWSRDQDARNLREASALLGEVLAHDRHNADAKWSLAEIEWLLAPPTWQEGADTLFPNLLGLTDASFRGSLDDSALARNNAAGALTFLGRRIAYEDGWHNLDIMYAYSLALALTGRGEEALFAWFRVVELIDSGSTTRVASAPTETQLKRLMGKHVEDVAGREDAEKLYAELRKQSDAWVASRAKYVSEQVALGRHPDTDPAFWSGWSLETPAQPERPEDDTEVSLTLLIGGLGGLVVVLLLILGFSVFIGRRSAPSPSVDEL
jgi:tetratricopeptide (TPR) repeat protein